MEQRRKWDKRKRERQLLKMIDLSNIQQYLLGDTFAGKSLLRGTQSPCATVTLSIVEKETF